MIVRTPQLQSDGLNLVSKSSGKDFFCLRSLKHEIDIPKAAIYWGEASDKQWPDKSGLKTEVYFDIFSQPYYRSQKKNNVFLLHKSCERFLKRFGCISDGPAKIIYFRVVYEE